MKIITALSVLLVSGQSLLEAAQRSKQTLVQTTARALVSVPKNIFKSSAKKELAKAITQRFNEQQTLLRALTELTQLPKELIGLIALYNQSTFFLKDVVASTLCSMEVISPCVVAVGCEDGSIYFVDVVEGRILQKLSNHKTPVHALCFSPQYYELASLSTLAGCIPTNLLFEFAQPEKNISQTRVHVFATEQEAKERDETLRIWRLGAEPTFGPRGYVGDIGTSQSHIEPISTWNLTTVVAADQMCKSEKEASVHEEVATLRSQGAQAEIIRERIWTATRSCTGTETALRPTIVQEKDATKYWYNNEPTMVLPKGKATSRWFSGSEDFLGWSSGEIVVIDNQEHTIKPSLKGHTAPVRLLWPFITTTGLACIASGSDDGTIRIWDTKTKKCLQTLIGHTAPIRAIKCRFGSYLVSIADDGTIRKWAFEF